MLIKEKTSVINLDDVRLATHVELNLLQNKTHKIWEFTKNITHGP